MASDPVFFNSVAMKLDDSESPIIPVNGDFATTANLLDVVSLLPTSGLVAKIRGFSGDKGSLPGTPYLKSKYAPSPVPPMNRRSTSSLSGSRRTDWLPRSTSITLPW